MRVRQEAQFELAGRGDDGLARRSPQVAGPRKESAGADSRDLGPGPGRPHPIATAAARASGARSSPCSPIADPEVRAQAAKVLGEMPRAEGVRRADRPARRRQPAGPLLRRDRAGQARPRRGDRAAAGDAPRQRRPGPLPAPRRRDGAGRLGDDATLGSKRGSRSVAVGADGRPAGAAAARRPRRSPGS